MHLQSIKQSSPIISATNVSISTTDGIELLKNVSFSVASGEVLAICGEEGSGKSSLLNHLSGRLDKEFLVSGSVCCAQAGRVVQQLGAHWHEVDLYEYFFKEYPDACFDPVQWERFAEVSSVLQQVGLNPELVSEGARTVGSLSGGQRTRLQMAKILLSGSEALLLDEPTSYLDIEGLEWLERFIRSFSGPVAVVSHDWHFMDRVATRVLYLQRSQKVGLPPLHRYNGTGLSSLLESFTREQEETLARRRLQQRERRRISQELNEAKTREESRARKDKPPCSATKGRQRRGLANATKRRVAREQMVCSAPLQEVVQGALPARIATDTSSVVRAGYPVISIRDESLTIGEKQLCESFSLRLEGPTILGITGANGVGKSTLLRHLRNHIQQSQSTTLKLRYVPQAFELTPDELQKTAIEWLSHLGFAQKVQATLAALQLRRVETTVPLQGLSGGQKMKVMLARAFLSSGNVMLLDEPSSGLSMSSAKVLIDFLQAYQGAAVVVSHDRNLLSSVADQVYHLSCEGLREVRLPATIIG